MARPVKGKIVKHRGADGLIYRALRFTAYGKRRFLSLGTVSEGQAETQLRHVLADVERGIWLPPREVATPEQPRLLPTFHEVR